MASTTIILGAEHDATLHQALLKALSEAGATVGETQWGVGGSQELVGFSAMLDGFQLQIESETYIGLSLAGDQSTVEKVANRTRQIYGAS